MKNKINGLKTHVRRISKSSLCVCLALLIMLGTMATFFAVVTDKGEVGKIKEVADTGYDNFKIIYSFDNGATSSTSSQANLGGTITVDCSSKSSDFVLYFKVKCNEDTMSYGGGGTMSSGNTYNVSTGNSGNWGKASVTKKNAKFVVTQSGNDIGVTYTNDGDALDGGSGGGSGGGSDDIAEAPSAVVSGTNIMFYICSYSGTTDNTHDANLTNGTTGTSNIATYGTDRGWTWLKNADSCVQIAKSDRTTFYYITNSKYNDWAGEANNSIKSANGGETFWANGSTGSNGAVTGTTTLSSNSVKVTGGSLTLSTTCSAKKSSYDKDLYIQYYLDGVWTEEDGSFAVVAANSAQTYSLPSATINALTPGTTHTIKTVLTDGTVYYIADTDTFTVASRLTTPSIQIDGSSSSSVTASTTAKSTITVTNLSTGGYPEGTEFKLYKGSTFIDANTTGVFSIARNSNTAATTYKVIAIPPASDNSHSDSLYSSTVTLTVTKVAYPSDKIPVISVDKNIVKTSGKVTVTITNYTDLDTSNYDLKLERSVNGGSTYTAIKTMTKNSYIDTANSSECTMKYRLYAKAKDSTVYDNSSYSNIPSVKVQSPKYYLNGDMVDSGNNKWDYITNYPVGTLFAENVFYRKVTVNGTGNHYFRVLTNNSQYPPTGATDTLMNGTGTNLHDSSETAVNINSSSGTSGAFYVTGAGTYYIFIDQNAKKVWVRTDLVDITIKKYRDQYSVSDDSYTTYDTTANETYVSVDTDTTFTIAKNTPFSVSAAVNDEDYDFLGWYSSYNKNNPDNNRIVTSNTLTVSGVTTAKTYYAVIRQEVPVKSSVHVDMIDTATVSATWNGRTISNGRELKNVPEGATVTISGTAETGNQFKDIKVKSADGTSIDVSGTKTGASISSVTFTMPASNVTVTATTEEYWGSEDSLTLWKSDTLGNPGAYTGSTWSKINITVYAQDGHHYAKIPVSYFSTTTHYFALSDDPSKVSDGKMSWTGDDTDTDASVAPGSEMYLTADEQKYEDTGHYWYRFSKAALTRSDYSSLIDYVLLDVTSTNNGKTGVYKYSVVLKESSGTVSSFIAKDGTLTYDGSSTAQYSTFARYSTVTVKSGNTEQGSRKEFTTSYGTGSGGYRYGTLTKGTTYTLQATVTDPRYYVKAFNVNGVSVAVLDKPSSTPSASAVYTCSYTVPSDAPAVLEIQPVYYNYDDSSCVTFYLEGYSDIIQEDLEWGNTPYVYPYYATQTGASSGGAENGHNAFGTYAGQPMVYYKGNYEIQIPTTNIDLAVGSGTGTETGTNIKGITINNGYYDLIHREIMGWPNDDVYHKQSYDYDDFHKIFVEKNPTNIYYEMRLREDRDNAQTYREYKNHSETTTLSASNITDIGSNGNGWDLLKDKFDRTTDILGNPLSGAALDADPLYVISTGYVANVAGDYGTEWRVYRKNGSSYSLVTGGNKKSIPPSLLFMTNAESFDNSVYPTNTHSFTFQDTTIPSPNSKPKDYLTLYNTLKNNYLNRPVYVSYEWNDRHSLSNYSELISGGSDNTTTSNAWRLDGRWYYTSAGDLISSQIQIEYLDGAGGYKTETSYVSGFSGKDNQGEHTGAQAYFTFGSNDTTYGYRTVSDIVLDPTKDFTMEATPAEGYEFVGWYKKQDTAYVSMNPTNKTSTTAETPRSSGGTYVARYKKLTKGSLIVSNTGTTGTVDGTTYNGTGKGLITVSYSINGGTSWTQIGDTNSQEPITVGTDILTDANLALGNNFQLKVVLGNTPDGEDTFGIYKNGYTNRTSSSLPTTYTMNLIDLFTVTTEDETTVYTQNRFSLPFYTYFNQHVYNYSITYSYTSTRLRASNSGATQTFTKTGTFTSAQLKDYVSGTGDSRRLTDAYITEIKPKESNFRQNMTFTVNSKGMNTVGDVTTFTGAASYTNVEDDSVKVTLDLPYVVTDRVVDGGYDLTPELTNPNFGTEDDPVYYGDGYWYDETIASFAVNFSTGYGKYLTYTATASDSVGDFLTAPETISTVVNDQRVDTGFSYWHVTDNAGNEVVKVYNREFNYRLFDNYTLRPVYDENINRAYAYSDDNKSASISYLGTTRNQWNNGDNGGYIINNNASANEASDILFNDFIVAFNYKEKEIKDVENSSCGIVLEKLQEVEEDSNGKVITDMGAYEAKADNNTALIETYIKTNATGGLTLKTYTLNTSNFDNKNRCEFFYNTYNKLGNETENRKASRNVYRAYSYIKVGNGSSAEVILSTPIYFTMYGEAN